MLIFIMGKLMHLARSVLWMLFIWELLPLGLYSQSSAVARSSRDEVRPKGACGSIDVRNRVENLRKIENCTVIEGELHILLIDYGREEEYDQYSFPDLVEITDHLMLYRVYGLRSLRNLFPNLAVIRGQNLFVDFALIAYEMPHMVELGLVSLTSIPRGGVRLEKNKNLCYIETIDWSVIATGVPVDENFIKDNKVTTECVNKCPNYCDRTKGRDKLMPRCWTMTDCQKMLSCPSNCPSGVCNGSICCDSNCIGGCSGPSASECTACKDVIQYGNPIKQTEPICASRCSPRTYKYRERRCLLDTQCTNFSDYKTSQLKLVSKEGFTEDGLCVKKCPTGFMNDEDDDTRCIPCPGKCPKVCIGKVVDSIAAVQDLKGCTKIKGPLEINIMGGSHIGPEFEANMAHIEEVTHYIRIYHSYALLSLHFFKNLQRIGGQELYQSRYSLVVFDNLNLQELFLDEVVQNLVLEKGTVWFQYNRKLCYKKISEFIQDMGIESRIKPEDVSEDTNGDQAACDIHQLQFSVMKVTPHIAILRWSTYRAVDQRQLISYTVNYKEAPDATKNISIYTGRDACSDDIWKTSEVRPDSAPNDTIIHNFITGLKPWTQYAAYVKTLTISKAVQGAVSKVIYFRTAAEVPTSPTNLVVRAELPGELRITWDPPNKPNGNVTHYQVYWQLHTLDPGEYELRDYCDDPITASMTEKKREEEEKEKEKNATTSGQCCACPKSSKELADEQRERDLEIRFQDFLQNEVYLKRLDRPATTIRPNRSRRQWRVRHSDPHEVKKYSSPPVSNVNTKPSMILSTSPPTVGTTTTLTSTTPKVNTPPKENPYFKAFVYGKRDLVIPNLGHFQDYNIEVIACQEKDPRDPERAMLCSNRALGLGRTLPDHKMDTLNSSYVTVSHIQNKTGAVRLHWKDPPNPNGLILTYEIQYKKTNMKNIMPNLICIPHKEYREKYKNGTIIEKLGAGNYSFRIRAISLAGNGSWTEEMYFSIAQMQVYQTPTETIVGVVVAVLFVIISITVVIVWYFAKRRYKKGLDTVVSTNPDYSMRDYTEYEPDEWEVDRDNVELIRELGQGSFGMVYEGLVRNLVSGVTEVKVAVKTTNTNSNDYERYMFLQEASIMKAFHCYHVVKLMGVVSKGQPALVLMELMANGDLKNFLRMHRPDEEDNNGRHPPTLKQILQIAGEIADGMAYLADKKYVHRDLAARNCMVGEDMVVKIGDFGMTRDIYETDYYRKGNRGLLPVRWMAPESLRDGVFTSMSDVWSFGIVLWEMATLAAQPYQGLSNEEVLRYVGSGKIMDTPERCPNKLYDLMIKCWRFRPKNRPTFKELIELLLPDLDKEFMEVSYFFSDENAKHEKENKQGGASNNANSTANSEATPPPAAAQVVKTAPPKVDFDMVDNGEEEDVNTDSLDNFVDEEHLPMLGAGASNGHSVELKDIFTDTGPFAHYIPSQKHSNSREGCECVMVRETDERGAAGQLADYNRQSVCSSPNSAIGGSSDGSKDSSKSSSSSYAHMNGVSVANGHGPVHVRTAPC